MPVDISGHLDGAMPHLVLLANASCLERSIIASFAEPCLAIQRVELNRLAGNQNAFGTHGAPMVAEFGSRQNWEVLSQEWHFYPVSGRGTA